MGEPGICSAGVHYYTELKCAAYIKILYQIFIKCVNKIGSAIKDSSQRPETLDHDYQNIIQRKQNHKTRN